jgi:8-oxo-dGTP pyrophosphatase MutT (NUDIX family)
MRIRATGLVIRQSAVLMVREYTGMWLLPGGSVGYDELSIVAAIRELYEETGVEARAAAFLFEHVSAHHVHHVYRMVIPDQARVRSGLEVESVQWVDHRELFDWRTTPGTRAIVARAFSKAPVLG